VDYGLYGENLVWLIDDDGDDE